VKSLPALALRDGGYGARSGRRVPGHGELRKRAVDRSANLRAGGAKPHGKVVLCTAEVAAVDELHGNAFTLHKRRAAVSGMRLVGFDAIQLP
jgi:hypothetical protein